MASGRSTPKIMIVAGEASGDTHAAAFYRELQSIIPGVRAFGMGGPRMAEASIDVRYDASAIAVIGVAEVLRHYPAIKAALAFMQELLLSEKPDLLVCVDYKEFNFRLARFAKASGIKVLFYVSPQVWAWRPGRVKKYGAAVDMMAVIFPFEVPYYQAYDVPVRFVGHPLCRSAYSAMSRDEARCSFGLPQHTPIVGLLPGSRHQEIRRLMPILLEACAILRQRDTSLHFILLQAHSVKDAWLDPYRPGCAEHHITLLQERYYDALRCCDAIISCSGTATLEAALLGVPMAISYRLAPLSYWLGKYLVQTPYIGLPNIIAGKAVVREFIQQAATPEALADEIARILNDAPYRERIRNDLSQIKLKLGEGDASKNLAKLAAKLVGMNA